VKTVSDLDYNEALITINPNNHIGYGTKKPILKISPNPSLEKRGALSSPLY
jgi:hypothetical protein